MGDPWKERLANELAHPSFASWRRFKDLRYYRTLGPHVPIATRESHFAWAFGGEE